MKLPSPRTAILPRTAREPDSDATRIVGLIAWGVPSALKRWTRMSFWLSDTVRTQATSKLPSAATPTSGKVYAVGPDGGALLAYPAGLACRSGTTEATKASRFRSSRASRRNRVGVPGGRVRLIGPFQGHCQMTFITQILSGAESGNAWGGRSFWARMGDGPVRASGTRLWGRFLTCRGQAGLETGPTRFVRQLLASCQQGRGRLGAPLDDARGDDAVARMRHELQRCRQVP